MALMHRFPRRFCDDRVLALRSLAFHHHEPLSLLSWIILVAGFIVNLLIHGLLMHEFAPAGDHDTVVLFLLGETVILVGAFLAGAGPALGPILDRAGIAGVDTPRQLGFVALEFAAGPVTLIVASSTALAHAFTLRSGLLSLLLALLLVFSWLLLATTLSTLLVVTARKFNVTPAAVGIGSLLLPALASVGPLALTGESLLRYVPLSGWTATGLVTLHAGDLVPALLWALLQSLVSAAIITALLGKGNAHAVRL